MHQSATKFQYWSQYCPERWTDKGLDLIYFPVSDTVMYFMQCMCVVLTDMTQNLEVNTGHSLF